MLIIPAINNINYLFTAISYIRNSFDYSLFMIITWVRCVHVLLKLWNNKGIKSIFLFSIHFIDSSKSKQNDCEFLILFLNVQFVAHHILLHTFEATHKLDFIGRKSTAESELSNPISSSTPTGILPFPISCAMVDTNWINRYRKRVRKREIQFNIHGKKMSKSFLVTGNLWLFRLCQISSSIYGSSEGRGYNTTMFFWSESFDEINAVSVYLWKVRLCGW